MPAPSARRLAPLAALIALALASGHAAAETFTWSGGTGYWDELNWTSTDIPSASDAVVFVDGGKDGIDSLVQVRISRRFGSVNATSASSLLIDSGDTVEILSGMALNIHDAFGVNGTLRNSGSFRMRAGVSAITGSGVIENRSNSFVGEQITLSAGITLFNEGSTRFQALNILGDYRAQGAEGTSLSVYGTLQQNGRLRVASGTELSLSVGSIASGGNAIEVEGGGRLTLSSDDVIQGQRFAASGGTAIFSGSTLSGAEFENDWRLASTAIMRDGVFVRQTLSLNGQKLQFDTDFVLDGGGRYLLDGGLLSQRHAQPYALTLATGTTLEGAGGILARTFTNKGHVVAGDPQDRLDINSNVLNEGLLAVNTASGGWGLFIGNTTGGSFAQTAAGRLVFQFDETVPGDKGIMRVYDATLDGAAELVFDTPPEIGVWYTGMWAAVGKIKGQFADVIAPTGWSVETHYDDNAVRFRVTAVPEPDTLALFAAGLGLIGAAARRRKV